MEPVGKNRRSSPRNARAQNELLPEETLAGGGGVTDPIGGGAAQFDLWVDVRKA